jgi:hypothetical protein
MNRRQTRWTSALTICAVLALVLTARAENWTTGLSVEHGCCVQANGQAVALSADKQSLLFGLASEKDAPKEKDALSWETKLFIVGTIFLLVSYPLKRVLLTINERKYRMVGREDSDCLILTAVFGRLLAALIWIVIAIIFGRSKLSEFTSMLLELPDQ